MNDQFVFAGSIKGEPWWSIGNIVAAILAPHGYDVSVSTDTWSHHNLEWTSSGRALIGATTPGHFAQAKARTQKYETMDVDLEPMRALAVITRPQWLGLAFRSGFGVTDLATVAAEQRPLRLLGSVEPTGALHTLLSHFGLSTDLVTDRGGSWIKWKNTDAAKSGEFDAVFGRLYSGYTPHMATWYHAIVGAELTFVPLPEELRRVWSADGSYQPAVLPRGFFPGVTADLPTVGTDQVVIYCKESVDAKLVETLVRGLDENSALFLNLPTPVWYERSRVAANLPIPLHPAAADYYRKVGYLS